VSCFVLLVFPATAAISGAGVQLRQNWALAADRRFRVPQAGRRARVARLHLPSTPSSSHYPDRGHNGLRVTETGIVTLLVTKFLAAYLLLRRGADFERQAIS
jgi:hypothetical protein